MPRIDISERLALMNQRANRFDADWSTLGPSKLAAKPAAIPSRIPRFSSLISPKLVRSGLINSDVMAESGNLSSIQLSPTKSKPQLTDISFVVSPKASSKTKNHPLPRSLSPDRSIEEIGAELAPGAIDKPMYALLNNKYNSNRTAEDKEFNTGVHYTPEEFVRYRTPEPTFGDLASRMDAIEDKIYNNFITQNAVIDEISSSANKTKRSTSSIIESIHERLNKLESAIADSEKRFNELNENLDKKLVKVTSDIKGMSLAVDTSIDERLSQLKREQELCPSADLLAMSPTRLPIAESGKLAAPDAAPGPAVPAIVPPKATQLVFGTAKWDTTFTNQGTLNQKFFGAKQPSPKSNKTKLFDTASINAVPLMKMPPRHESPIEYESPIENADSTKTESANNESANNESANNESANNESPNNELLNNELPNVQWWDTLEKVVEPLLQLCNMNTLRRSNENWRFVLGWIDHNKEEYYKLLNGLHYIVDIAGRNTTPKQMLNIKGFRGEALEAERTCADNRTGRQTLLALIRPKINMVIKDRLLARTNLRYSDSNSPDQGFPRTQRRGEAMRRHKGIFYPSTSHGPQASTLSNIPKFAKAPAEFGRYPRAHQGVSSVLPAQFTPYESGAGGPPGTKLGWYFEQR